MSRDVARFLFRAFVVAVQNDFTRSRAPSHLATVCRHDARLGSTRPPRQNKRLRARSVNFLHSLLASCDPASNSTRNSPRSENQFEVGGARRHGVEGLTHHGVSRLSPPEHRWSSVLRQMRRTAPNTHLRRRSLARIHRRRPISHHQHTRRRRHGTGLHRRTTNGHHGT